MPLRTVKDVHPLAYVRVNHADGHVETGVEVSCPYRGESMPAEACAACPRFVRVNVGLNGERDTLQCAPELRLLPPREILQITCAQVTELMTRDVVCAHASLDLDAAARLFFETGLRSLPVVEGDRALVGFVSEHDVELAVQSGRATGSTTVAEVMSGFPLSVCESARVTTAAALLSMEGQDRLGVLGRGGRLIGLLSTTDVLRWLARADAQAI